MLSSFRKRRVQKMDPSGVKVLETAEDIQERRQQVLDRYHRFKELSTLRRQKLEDSYRFQFFQRDAEELEKWIQEKLQIASDENYKDPTNLQVCAISIRFVPKLKSKCFCLKAIPRK
uniref:Spectrin alpha, non-erythrocytic 1 n=1 Tax=Pipistrellus kuhlii TaxID=59472 RepID=A0A7J7S476_PIPKU|nr:spectrin alpha, non-erythrocytic 1 [Pipistrellus kuhlii]